MRRAAGILFAVLLAFSAQASERDDQLKLVRAALEDRLFEAAESHAQDYIKIAGSKNRTAEGQLFLAQALEGQGRDEEALRIIEQLIEDDRLPKSDTTYWSARLLYKLERYDSALEQLSDFQGRFRTSDLRLDAARLEIRCLLASGNREAAMEAFSRVKEEFDGKRQLAGHQLDWASALILEGSFEDAREVLEELLEKSPDAAESDEAAMQLGRVLLELGSVTAGVERIATVFEGTNLAASLRMDAGRELFNYQVRTENWSDAGQTAAALSQLSSEPSQKAWYEVQQGLMTIRSGAFSNGLALFNKALVRVDDTDREAESMLQLGRILYEESNYGEAERVLQNFLEAFPGQKGIEQALALKGWVLWAEEKYAEAAQAFLQAYEAAPQGPGRAEFLVKAADAEFAQSLFDKALEHYEAAVKEAVAMPLLLRAQYQAGECHARAARWDEAREAFAALSTNTVSPDFQDKALLRLATLYEDQGLLDDAVKAYDEALEHLEARTARASAQHSRGLLKYRLGKFAQALEDFEGVYTNYPLQEISQQSDYMRGWCHYLLGSRTNALDICRDFLGKHPNSRYAEDVRYWLAEYYYKEGNYDEARAGFVELVDQVPDGKRTDAALYWAGRAAMQANDFLGAIDLFNRLGNQYGDSLLMPETRFAQGEALSQLGKFSGAILAFEELIKNYPGHYLANAAWGRIGDCQFTLGRETPDRYREAIAAYRNVLDDIHAGTELHFQAEYKIARCWEKLGDVQKAVEHYTAVVYKYFNQLERGVQPGDLWLTRSAFAAASLLEREGRVDESIRIYRRVIDAGVKAAKDAQERINSLQE